MSDYKVSKKVFKYELDKLINEEYFFCLKTI